MLDSLQRMSFENIIGVFYTFSILIFITLKYHIPFRYNCRKQALQLESRAKLLTYARSAITIHLLIGLLWLRAFLFHMVRHVLTIVDVEVIHVHELYWIICTVRKIVL